MQRYDARKLTFETMLTDPLIREVMQADGVTLAELLAAMEVAHRAVVARERLAVREAAAGRLLGQTGG